MVMEILLTILREQNMLAVYASAVALVFNVVGLASVKWNKGRMFLGFFARRSATEEDTKTKSTSDGGNDSLQVPYGTMSRKQSVLSSTSNASILPIERPPVTPTTPHREKRLVSVTAGSYFILAPLALFFLAIMVRADLPSLEEALAVTGSSYSFIILMSAAAMGVIFTHPLVWYPMGVASLAILFRCGFIAWSIFNIYTNGAMPLVVYSNNSSAIAITAPPTDRQVSVNHLITGRPDSSDDTESRLESESSPLEPLVDSIPGLEKRDASVYESEHGGLQKRSEENISDSSKHLAKRNGIALLNTSLFGRIVHFPTAEGRAWLRKVSTPYALLAALGGVMIYLSSSFLAVVVGYRFAKRIDRGHRLRFIQTKVVQQDRDRLTRERDRSARLLAIVFPKPVIANLLSLWAKNNRGINRFDAVLESQRALDGNVEDGSTETGGNLGSSGTPPSSTSSDGSGTNDHLEFADRINDVVVAFVDFYTPDIFAAIGGQDGVHDKCANSRAHARRAVALLNLTFEKFDAILEKYPGVEKIKTIGTKVMIAGGLFDTSGTSGSTANTTPVSSGNSTMSRFGTMNSSKTGVIDRPPLSSKSSAAEMTLLMLRLALETLDTMNFYDPGELDECFEYEEENNDDNVPCTCTGKFNLNSTTPRCVRFGIASGTVVAGIVGLERFCLDLWGDSVNTASRMLSAAGKNEVVVTEGIRDGFQYLQTGKMAKVLGMVEVRDDFRFSSLGRREIKGKGMMELFYVTNPAYVNYPSNTPPHSSQPSLIIPSPQAKRRKPRRNQPTNYRDATAELVAAALGLAKDAEESNAEEEGTNRTSLLRRSLDNDDPVNDKLRRSSSPISPDLATARKPNGRYRALSSPVKMRELREGEKNLDRLGTRTTQLGSAVDEDIGSAVSDSPSIQNYHSETPWKSTSPALDSSEVVLPVDNVQAGDRIHFVTFDHSFDDASHAQANNGRPRSRGHRLSMVIADLTPAFDPDAAESWGARARKSRKRGNTKSTEFLTSNVIANILNDFLSMPTSELSYDRQFSKLSSHLHKWLLRFKDPRIEHWYRSVAIERQTFKQKPLELLWDGCVASMIAFAVASAEIFAGGPPSVTMDSRLLLSVPASRPGLGYWIALAGLVVHLGVAHWVTWEKNSQRQHDVRKKKQNRRVVLNAGGASYPMSELSNSKRIFGGRPDRSSIDKTPLMSSGGGPEMQESSSSTPASVEKLPRLRSAFHLFVYHTATLSFFLTITSLLSDTPIGDRAWFAPALLVTPAFYSIYLDIGAPSFIRSSLWTALLLLISTIVLFLQHRMTEIEALVIASFGFLAFLMLARATQRAKRTGFLLGVVVDKQKYLSAGEARRSAQLLMSILPERILRRVIDNPRAMVVEEFAAVTFLHLDIVDFTALSAALAPDAVVALLNVLFTKFDAVCRQYGVEKMTTIGDAYVAFGLSASAMEAAEAGISSDVDEEIVPIALATCKAALELQRVVDEFNASEFARDLLAPSGKTGVRVRVAVHTGRGHGCVLGGTTRLKYEFVGEAIRVAERVQEKTPKGYACVSEATVRKMGREAYGILETGRGVVDGIYMRVEPDQVDGMNYFVMSRPIR